MSLPACSLSDVQDCNDQDVCWTDLYRYEGMYFWWNIFNYLQTCDDIYWQIYWQSLYNLIWFNMICRSYKIDKLWSCKHLQLKQRARAVTGCALCTLELCYRACHHRSSSWFNLKLKNSDNSDNSDNNFIWALTTSGAFY